ncbi:type II CAAX endopeptidase family protein [Spirulina major CS-329]|uniref:CPBP family intramembrane glutamic endopeptidase n=1 Tax=Spirulina TaxID=1154 RepID=UPI00232C1BBD|nr:MULTISPECIES: type II CAAX endopeptidase family protein [Spirulina]MDB9493108.1 type II CAAX endopeptidase family protein [Spirulina subsalsa CS-330]MDB9503289.1 type II CAAX endopeptidase family protein [Spirulina major CS-329]
MTLPYTKIAALPVLWRVGVFLLGLAVIWIPLALPLHLLLRSDPNTETIATMGLLFIEFFLLVWFWGRRVKERDRPFAYYGLVWTRQNGLYCLHGLALGTGMTIALFLTMAACGWVEFVSADHVVRVMVEGLGVALGVGLAEEFVFRGWLLDELETDYSPSVALWSSAVLFAIAHYLKPVAEMIRTFPQFPSLVLLGLILVWAKRQTQHRLGLSIGLHGGLVWGYYIINVGALVQYRDRVPPWVTGIDRNPLAGLLGITFLIALALWVRRRGDGICEDRPQGTS